ncbi:MAG: RluA family pseudouridine synthase [Anderseniella sp.]
MSNSQETLQLVHDGAEAQRLDKLLGTAFPDISRARFQTLIAQGNVNVNGKVTTQASQKILPGTGVDIIVPVAEDPEPQPEAIPLDIVFEDTHVIVINKQAGLVVHPGPGNWTGTLVNALIHHCGDSLSGIGGVKRPGIVHRLDKETSGLLVVAKTDKAHQLLSEQFAAHGRDGKLSRQYMAITWGEPAPRRGTIDTMLARSTTNRVKMAVTKTAGRRAITHYETLKTFMSSDGKPLASLVQCNLETGRTHQIRVHMSHIGHPLLGDMVYGAGHAASANKLAQKARSCLEALNRQALHAQTLGFEHPETGDPMVFETELPSDMQALIDELS